jgi:hypothetical protein
MTPSCFFGSKETVMGSLHRRLALCIILGSTAMCQSVLAENQKMPMMGHSTHQMMEADMMSGSGPMIEGRLASLKAELGITEAQGAAWDGYASAVKSRGAIMHGKHSDMMHAMHSGTAMERMNAHTTAMQTMLDTMKALKPATEALYKVLNDDQKKKADDLLGSGCCMM